MEDGITRKYEHDTKLQMESSHLSMLKDSLQKSSSMTDNMVSILTSFEERLMRLEETIVPVYQETGNLQRRQENADKIMLALDHVISFYHVAKEVGNTIKEGPAKKLEEYIICMEKLQRAVNYFSTHQPGSPELVTVNTLFSQGKESLEEEFKVILNKHSKPVPAVTVLDMCDENEDDTKSAQSLVSEDEDETRTTIQHLPEEAVTNLHKIAKWLVSNSDNSDFLNSYATVRAAMLMRSIQSFRDHVKAQSGGAVSASLPMSPAPSLVRNFKATSTPNKRGSSKKHHGFMRKASTFMKQTSHALEAGGPRKHASLSIDWREEEEVESDIYINCVTATLKLVQSEAQLMTQIVPDKFQRKLFDQLVQQALDSIVGEGEQISSTAKKAVAKHEYAAVLLLFPVVRHLRSIKPEFDFALEGCQTPTRAKIASLIAILDSTGAKALEDFIDDVKNDPDKVTNMPKDGTVHEISTNTVIFLQNLQQCVETAGAMLTAAQDAAQEKPLALGVSEVVAYSRKLVSGFYDPSALTQDTKKYAMKVAEYMTRVLSALSLNLTNKAQSYSDPTLNSVFMMNNYNYIMKALDRDGLLDLIHQWNPDVKKFYEAQIIEQKRMYSQSFSRVMHYILEVHKPMSQQKTSSAETMKLKDKERQIIKDKFAGFNKEIEDLYRVQRGYAIPDPELQKSLILENKDYVITRYQVFLDKYQQMAFTKNITKYIKYKVADLEQLLEKFFDSAS